MKEPTFAPAYVGVYPILAEIARERGYALAVHGSVSRDLDLVAVPWTDRASDSHTLIRSLASAIGYRLDSSISLIRLFSAPYMENKPHGRVAWCIPLDCGAALDISVIPRAIEATAELRRIMSHIPASIVMKAKEECGLGTCITASVTRTEVGAESEAADA